MSQRARVLLVSPIRPGLVGSGLAVRAELWARALAEFYDLTTLVVPVADGGARPGIWPMPAGVGRPEQSCRVVALPSAEQRLSGLVRALSDEYQRALIAVFDVDIPQVVAAPPWLGWSSAEHAGIGRRAEASVSPGGGQFDVVVCFRAYLVPFVAGLLAASSPAAALVVDLDDDDAALARDLGHHGLGASFDRLRTWIGLHADVIAAAAPVANPAVRTVPNCVDVPDIADAGPATRNGCRVLFVGNLTYGPNIEGVDWYLANVHPLVRAERPEVVVRLVGRGSDRWSGVTGVDAAGLVGDVHAEYAAAQLVVAPVLHGSGTRIKVLEAWAHNRPVVATTAAVAGLECTDGVDVVLADTPAAMSAAIIRLLGEAEAARSLATAGRASVRLRYSRPVFESTVSTIVEPLLTTRRRLSPDS